MNKKIEFENGFGVIIGEAKNQFQITLIRNGKRYRDGSIGFPRGEVRANLEDMEHLIALIKSLPNI